MSKLLKYLIGYGVDQVNYLNNNNNKKNTIRQIVFKIVPGLMLSLLVIMH